MAAQDQDDEKEFETLLEEISGTGVKTEVIIRLLGIQNCVDTMVGNAYLRGVSGGERKRVTSAEMLVGTKVTPGLALPSNTIFEKIQSFCLVKQASMLCSHVPVFSFESDHVA